MELSKICNFVPEASSHFRILIYRVRRWAIRAIGLFSKPPLLTRIARTRLACTHSSFNDTQENSLKKAA